MHIKLLIADAHPMMLNGLRQALSEQSDLLLAGEAGTGEEAVKMALELCPDLVVMDIHLPELDGIEATRQILKARPAVKVLIFTADANHMRVQEALQARVSGYILKQCKVDELIRAIRVVMGGTLYLSPEVSANMAVEYRRTLLEKMEPAKLALTDQEKRLLRLITEGRRNKEIAAALKLSPNSIETYRARLMKKVGYRNTAELVRYAIREGIAPL